MPGPVWAGDHRRLVATTGSSRTGEHLCLPASGSRCWARRLAGHSVRVLMRHQVRFLMGFWTHFLAPLHPRCRMRFEVRRLARTHWLGGVPGLPTARQSGGRGLDPAQWGDLLTALPGQRRPAPRSICAPPTDRLPTGAARCLYRTLRDSSVATSSSYSFNGRYPGEHNTDTGHLEHPKNCTGGDRIEAGVHPFCAEAAE